MRILKTILLLFGVFILFWGHDIFISKFYDMSIGLLTGFIFLVLGYQEYKNVNYKKNNVILGLSWHFVHCIFSSKILKNSLILLTQLP